MSRSAKPGADILISNLSPATWYQIKVKSQSGRIDSMKFQVTGERSSGDQTSLEFEIATLATDGSRFSGDKALLTLWPRLCHREGGEVLWEHH